LYIGTIPTPASTESRQEFTCTAGQLTFNTTGGTTGYIDCFLNGVKLDSRSDFSFDGSVVTLTTGAAAGDILAVIMRQADNALVALPIKDSAGNNVIHEANGVVNFSNPMFKTGTFTPFFAKINTTTEAYTYTGTSHIRHGQYTKIGKLVFFEISINHNGSALNYNTGVSASDSVAIGGLPYAPEESSLSGTSTTVHGSVLEISFNTSNSWTGYTKFGLFKKDYSQIALYYPGGSTINNVGCNTYNTTTVVSTMSGHYFTEQND